MSTPKKLFSIINIPSPKTPKDIKVYNGVAQFINDSFGILPASWPHLPNYCGRYFFEGIPKC
jgi:hypothetical protein